MPYKVLCVFEGQSTEPVIFDQLQKGILSQMGNAVYYSVFGAEIYQLWKEVEADPNLDLIGLLQERRVGNLDSIRRSEFTDVYLFFDHDSHSHPEVADYDALILSMIGTFYEATENGKIYISYPMVEALKDCSRDLNVCFSCLTYVDENTQYKQLAASRSSFNAINQISDTEWYYIFRIHILKARALVLGITYEEISLENYNLLTQVAIAEKQKTISEAKPKKIAVISGIPFFVIDYCGESLLSRIIERGFQKHCGFGCIAPTD